MKTTASLWEGHGGGSEHLYISQSPQMISVARVEKHLSWVLMGTGSVNRNFSPEFSLFFLLSNRPRLILARSSSLFINTCGAVESKTIPVSELDFC